MFNFNKQCLEKDAASSTYSKKLKRNYNHDDDTATTLTGSETTAGTTIIINSRPSHSTTPDSSTSPSTHTSRRLNVPIIEVENPIDKQRCIMSNYHPNKWEEILVKQNKNIQEILVKQGKQIRVLYELQKSTNEKLTWVQNQLKSQPNKKDDIDLDQKVFMEGYSQLCRSFFPDNLWPNFNDYKVGLENWLNKNHPNYLKELGEQKWTNLFTGQHHSMELLTNNGSIKLSDSASVMQEEAPETMKKKKDEEEKGDVNAEDEEERDQEQYFDALFEEN
ncbi:hypothetical protein RirG_164230 [Rhizophagus irregularis DAOM 197198w]|uniref:Uncharacterized protein n=1 Tax=Rhizophagus irregularis (strain DAOM 197198w) TaxID=1432141 RepID=A0A015KQV8_RHIIW|nr:hypothetical protein RirG_164230 [Rhizophagus irregularis DAOM 197198w]